MNKLLSVIVAALALLSLAVSAQENALQKVTATHVVEVELPVKKSAVALPLASDAIRLQTNDGVFQTTQDPATGLISVRYVWPTPAVVYQLSIREGQDVFPRRSMAILKINTDKKARDAHGNPVPARSKAELRGAISMRVTSVAHELGETVMPGDLLLEAIPQVLAHDSVTPSENKQLSVGEMAKQLWYSTGIYSFIQQTRLEWTLGLGKAIMIGVGLLLLYLAIFRGFEPLLLLPIGFGAIMSNIPLADIAGPDGILGILFEGVNLGIYPLLIFLGIGAMTDFGPLIANPRMALLGGAAQLGIFAALIGAVLISAFTPDSIVYFSIKDAASIGIIGGADGPTAIFLSSRLSPNLLGSIAVAAYSYMALVPIIQPPIIKLLTSKEDRMIRMSQLRQVSKLEKVVFPIIITLLCCLLLPSAAPLIGMLMLGNLMRESMCVDRLSDTAQNALINIVTIFLGLCVGSKLSADKFLNFETLGILFLGLVAFSIGTAGGVLMGKVMCKLSGGKVNPMIGAAGVSAVPMAARVVNKIGLEEDPQNFLLMHAMGPNVSGVIGSAVAAGVLLSALG
jgi:sodium ion-translocating decarboxylase beta subunit